MRIIRNGIEEEVVVVTYFTLNKTSFLSRNAECAKYIIYADKLDTDKKTLYLSKVFDIDNTINLILPEQKELETLKPIISNFLAEDSNVSVVIKNKYEYINIKELEDKQIIEVSGQKIQITKEKYLKLLANKYLTYPDMKLINMDEIQKEGLDKYNKIARPISLLLLLITFLLLTMFDTKDTSVNIFSLSLLEFLQTAYLAKFIILIVFSIISYNNEDKKIYFSFILITLLTMLLLFSIKYILPNKAEITVLPFNITELSTISLVIISLVYSIFLTIMYFISKKLSFIIINKIKIRNYLSYSIIFIILFVSLYFVITSIYVDYLQEFINKIIVAI